MDTRSDCRYSKDHEWVRLEGKEATIGITDHAQEALGSVVFVELPEEDSMLEAGDVLGVIESVKAASERSIHRFPDGWFASTVNWKMRRRRLTTLRTTSGLP